MTELELHRAVASFLDWMLLPPAAWTTFPAGWTAMNKGAAGRLRGCGLRAGMPDILVFHNGFTIGIELKTDTGHLSAAQLNMFHRLRNAGVMVHICRSIENVHEALALCHKIPMRKFSHGNASHKASEGHRPQEPAQGESRAAP